MPLRSGRWLYRMCTLERDGDGLTFSLERSVPGLSDRLRRSALAANWWALDEQDW